MTSEQDLDLAGGAAAFEGAVSVEHGPGGVRPWRLRFDKLALYEPALIARAGSAAGVRLTFLSDTRNVTVEAEPCADAAATWTWDLLVDGKLHQRVTQLAGGSEGAMIRFTNLPGGLPSGLPSAKSKPRRIEVYLPTAYLPLRIRRVTIDAGASVARWNDTRKRWVVYGSSITHAKEAAGPSETWPAIVANTLDLHLTALGYGGQEHMEPMVTRMIRDLPADCISTCVGGNIWGGATLNERTYRAAVIGMVETIRDKHPRTPLAVVSFITSPLHEGVNNLHCADVGVYRQWTRDAVEALQQCGDGNVFYVHGPELYPAEHCHLMDDGVHPNAEGQKLLAKRYLEMVMPRLARQ